MTAKPSKAPLQDSQQAVSRVALFAARDVRKATELLFVNTFWGVSLSPKSIPGLWKDHAHEALDPEGKFLILACAKNLPNIIEILLTKLSSSSSSSSPSVSLQTLCDVDGQTPLMFAVQNNEIDLARCLITMGSNVNAQDTIITVGETALHRAACNGNREMCQLLLDNGANVNILDESGWNPMLASIHHGKLDVLKLLLEKMLKESRGQTTERVEIKSTEAATSSPETGNEFSPATNPTATSSSSTCQPSSAIFARHFTEIRDVNGNNIFHCAAASGSVECIDFLCNVILTDSTTKTTTATTPNEKPVDTTTTTTVERQRHLTALMTEAARVTKRTPLQCAVESGSEDAVQAILKRCGVLVVDTIDAQDVAGDTALIKAARRGYDKLVSLLLKSGAKKEIRNEDGETALDVAAARKNDSCVKLLSERKSDGCCC